MIEVINKHKYKLIVEDETRFPNVKIVNDWNEVKEYEFETPDDFRKWVNQLYKKFGGVTDYIILLAHQQYHKAQKVAMELKAPLLLDNRIEKPYCHLIDIYHMKEEEVWERIEDLVDKGYLEYGVNIRYAWLTEKGEAYLNELSKANQTGSQKS